MFCAASARQPTHLENDCRKKKNKNFQETSDREVNVSVRLPEMRERERADTIGKTHAQGVATGFDIPWRPSANPCPRDPHTVSRVLRGSYGVVDTT